MTNRVLEMEYVRKIFLSDKLHFMGFKQHRTFHIHKYVGPFQFKSLSSLQYIEGFIKHLNLEKDEPASYNLHKVFLKKRLQNNNSFNDSHVGQN